MIPSLHFRLLMLVTLAVVHCSDPTFSLRGRNGLVLDTSGSMSTKLPLLKEAAVQFVRAGNPEDEYYFIEFRDRPEVTLPGEFRSPQTQ